MKKKILRIFLRCVKILLYLFVCFALLSYHVLIGILFIVCSIYLYSTISFSLPLGGCYLWLGVPGSGKTTIAAWIANHYLKDGEYRVFSNVPIKGTLKYSWKYHFGKYNMKKSVIICDEAGIYLNGRNWKSNFSEQQLETTKKFRHHEMTLHFFSQANDEDPIVRNLSMCTYVVERSLIKWFVKYRCIGMKYDIPESTQKHDRIEFWKPFSTRYVFCPPAWKLFDTLECEELPDREWETW